MIFNYYTLASNLLQDGLCLSLIHRPRAQLDKLFAQTYSPCSILLLRGNAFFIRISYKQFRTNFFEWEIWLGFKIVFDLLLLWLHDLDSEHRASTVRNCVSTRGRHINFWLFSVEILYFYVYIFIRGSICCIIEEGCLQWMLISHKFARKHLSTPNLTIHRVRCRTFNHLMTTEVVCITIVSILFISICEFLFRI